MDRRGTHKLRMDTKVVGGVRFLHQQDGASEREFMQKVKTVLRGVVQRAYLVRVEYANTGTSAVALCLCAAGSKQSLATAVGAIFSRMFGSNQHLDILFLNSDQEREIIRVCVPFFVSAP